MRGILRGLPSFDPFGGKSTHFGVVPRSPKSHSARAFFGFATDLNSETLIVEISAEPYRYDYQTVRRTFNCRIWRSAVSKDSPSTKAVAPMMRSAGSFG
jgi:hypothetical protein